MSTTKKESLNQSFRDLHAHREKTMDPALLQKNISQRRQLVETTDRALWPRVGEHLKPFTLHEVDSGELTSAALVAEGPAVLVFFRYEGCPACNLALPYYERNLAAPLRELGIRLVAVSPQAADELVAIKRRHSLSYEVATDGDNTLGRRLHVTFSFDREFPMPTVLLLDQQLGVHFVDVSPDWLVRTEADPILEAARALTPIERTG